MNKLLIAVLLFATHPLFAGETKSIQIDNKLPKVLIIGDSISLGYTPYVVKMLEGVASVEHNKGNAGPTMRGLENIEEWIGNTPWDVIHFNWGLWDMYGWMYQGKERTPEIYEKNLETLVVRLEKTGARLIWATTTPVCPKPETKARTVVESTTELAYRDAALRVMKKHNIPVDDLYSVIAPVRDQYTLGDDNVHYKPEGSKLLAEQVVVHIKSALKEKSTVPPNP